jgi:hypothetical protein
MFSMIQVMMPFLSSMPSCFIGTICKDKAIFQNNTLCGHMVDLTNLKVHAHGTLYQGIPIYTTNSQLGGCQIMWNYFAIRHGKSKVDEVGALLKREVKKEQIKPNNQKN